MIHKKKSFDQDSSENARKTIIEKPVGVTDLILVEGGSFIMGCDGEEASYIDKPAHQVNLDTFCIGKFLVTQKIYQEIMGDNPSYFKGESLPVDSVTWYNAIEFCNKLSEREELTPVYTINKNQQDPNYRSEIDKLKWTIEVNWLANGYRLPTEAEWEYAAKGGKKSNGYKYSGSDDADEIGWHGYNSEKTTHPVGEKKGNELSIYDMSGNLWEWCWDWFSEYTSEASNPPKQNSGEHRISRGGGWFNYQQFLHTWCRHIGNPDLVSNFIGFRIARNPS